METNDAHDDTRPNRTRRDSLSRRAHGTTSDGDADRQAGAPPGAHTGHRSSHTGHTASHTDSPAGPAPAAATGRYAWLAILPAAVTLLGVTVGIVVGFGVFDTTQPGAHRVVAYLLLVPYFLLGVAGTLWLYEDAARLAAEHATWQPNPWYYIVGGGLVLELYYLAPVLTGAGPRSGVVAYLAGGFVIALLLSSVVAGPVYALQRHRHLGTP